GDVVACLGRLDRLDGEREHAIAEPLQQPRFQPLAGIFLPPRVQHLLHPRRGFGDHLLGLAQGGRQLRHRRLAFPSGTITSARGWTILSIRSASLANASAFSSAYAWRS